jgi:hypothetical protein
MTGINRVLQLTWEIAEKPTEDKTRLQALFNLTKVTSSKMGAIFTLILRHHGTLAQILPAI